MPQTTFTRESWDGVLYRTRETYLKQKVENTIRSRLLFALMRKRGRLKMNLGGTDFTWLFDIKLPQPLDYGDAQGPVFTRKDYTRQATIAPKSFYVTDQITWHNERQNRGPDALGSLVGDKLNKIGDALEQYLNGQLYLDGYTNATKLHGLESFIGTGTTAAGDIIGEPSDTYGTISTALKTFGGTWSSDLATSPNSTVATDWPYGGGANGTMDIQYDVWSPRVWNASSTGWGTGGTTWADNCLALIRNAVTCQRRLLGNKCKTDVFITDDQQLIDVKDALEPRFRVQVPHKEATDLGFPEVVNYDGLMVDTDYNCPSGSGYGLCVNEMELFTQTEQLFDIDGPNHDFRSDSTLFLGRFLGNARYNSPRFHWAEKLIA